MRAPEPRMDKNGARVGLNCAGPMPVSPSARRVSVPDHDLIRLAGQGAYGEVWLARSVLGTYRAVKIVHRSSFSSDEPYEREFSGIRKYEPVSRGHEGLVDILQAGRNEKEGYFYYLMELADDAGKEPNPGFRSPAAGRDTSQSGPGELERGTCEWEGYSPRTLLSEIHRCGRLPPEECARIGLLLSRALEHLHGQNLLHRDVKPSNVIFVQGVPKLADIGLVTETSSARTFVGTEGFIPPEGPNSPQADLYSLGMVLYEISSGKMARDFPEPALEMIKGRECAAWLELNAVILKACAADPRRRYASAEQLSEDLSLLQRGRSVAARHARQRLFQAGHRVAFTLALLTMVAGTGYMIARRPIPAGLVAPQKLTVNDGEFWGDGTRPRKFDVSPDGQRIVFASDNGLWLWEAATSVNRPLELSGLNAGPASAEAEWKVPRLYGLPRWAPDGRHFIFQAFKKVGGTAEGPVQFAAWFLTDPESGETRQIGAEVAWADRATDLCWMPDGKAVTYLDGQRRFYTMALTGGRTLWLDAMLLGQGPVQLGGYSLDGDWLLFSAGGGNDAAGAGNIWLIPHAGGRAMPLVHRRGVDVDPAWGPDGETAYFVSNDGHRTGDTWGLWKIRVDLKTGLPKGTPQHVFTRPGQRIHYPEFAARGTKLIYAVEHADTTVLLANGQMERPLALVRRGQQPVPAPDGQTIYFVSETGDLRGVHAIDRSADSRTLRQITRLVPLSHGLTRGGLSLSPDGAEIALFSYQEAQRRFGVFVIPAAGGEPRLVEEWGEFEGVLPVWSPDSQWLAFASGQTLYRVSRDGTVREPLAALYRWQGWTVRWAPDGRHIAALAYETPAEWEQNPGVFVIDVAERTWKKLTPESEDKYKEGLEWHPSGEYLTYFFYGPEQYSAQIRRAYPDGRLTSLMIDQEDHWDYLGVWAPEGRWFFFSSFGCGPALHRYDAHTREILHGVTGGGLPEWSRDGQTVVWTTGSPERWFEVLDNFR